MEGSRNTPTRTLLVSILLGALVVPLTFAAPALSQGSCLEGSDVGYITRSHPLQETITATELAYFVVAPLTTATNSQRHLVNGVDGFVVDLGCEVQSGTFSAADTGPGDENCDLSVRFLDEDLDHKGDLHNNVHSGEPENGVVPPGSRYAVVLMEDGPVVTGLRPQLPATPYACKVTFTLAI